MNKKKLFIVFALIFMIALCFQLFSLFKMRNAEQSYEDMAKQYTTQSSVADNPAAEKTGYPGDVNPDGDGDQSEVLENPIDFKALQELNPDIYAWITIPGTAVNYALVQHEDDDSYYLNHTVEGAAGYPGSIYTERLNHKDFTDPNTVIYGHNMKDGTMFGGLYQYKDADFMKQNDLVYLYTPQSVFQYRIFGGVTYDDRHILKFYEFEEPVQYQQYLDSVLHVRNLSSYINEEITVDTDDRIITLSTCTKSDDQRFLILAVMIKEQSGQ